jgi:hypothetical protein
VDTPGLSFLAQQHAWLNSLQSFTDKPIAQSGPVGKMQAGLANCYLSR